LFPARLSDPRLGRLAAVFGPLRSSATAVGAALTASSATGSLVSAEDGAGVATGSAAALSLPLDDLPAALPSRPRPERLRAGALSLLSPTGSELHSISRPISFSIASTFLRSLLVTIL